MERDRRWYCRLYCNRSCAAYVARKTGSRDAKFCVSTGTIRRTGSGDDAAIIAFGCCRELAGKRKFQSPKPNSQIFCTEDRRVVFCESEQDLLARKKRTQ